MNTNSSLILGLGGVGILAARGLRDRMAGTPQARTARFLYIDAPGPGGLPSGLADSELPLVESVPLSMEAVRDILDSTREWTEYLPWLPSFDRGVLLDELRPYGMAGYRCLGRLALLRSAEIIDRALRRNVHGLREAAPVGFTDCILIAGAGGGLGSSILADVTFLLQRLAPTVSRTACLVLPPAAEPARSRFQANAFASLCEAFAIKTRKALWENRFETLPALRVEPRTGDPWQRFYLFQAGLDELPPYEATTLRVADALAQQVQPEIAERRHIASQDLPVLDLSLYSAVPRSDTGFSACHGAALDPDTLIEAPIQAGAGPGVSVDRFLLDEAVKMFVAAAEQDLLDLRDVLYQKRKNELRDLHGDLSVREKALLKSILEPEETDASRPLELDPDAVLRLPGAEKALRWLWAEIQKPAPAVPPSSSPDAPANLLPARQHISDLKDLREDAAVIWKTSSASPPPAEGKRSKRRLLLPRLQRNMLWNLAQRFSSAQSLLRTPELHSALCEAFEEILRRWKRQEDGDSQRSYPTLEEWLEQLQGDLQAVARTFQASTPQSERRHFAWLLLPSELPEGLSRRTLRERIEGVVRESLQCDCQTFESKDGMVRLYYEDLFRSPKEIRNLQVYRKAYKEEPRKEILHADYRFFEKGVCPQLYGEDLEGPVSCGNPGCETDIRNHPREATICPGCGKVIRSRCGDPKCKIINLHERPEANNRTCPGCGGVNRAAWWVCCQHGKVDHYVPIDKDSCPECIRRHHEDPVAFSLSQVGRRPDIRGNKVCPHCEELKKKDPSHQVFRIPADLEPFVDHGVNGHDRQRFLELAEKHNLMDDYKCPNCATLLIPVDHRDASTSSC
ncbi:MAG: tubulin-like doman-containing protein [Acidobacteriota bacterium]